MKPGLVEGVSPHAKDEQIVKALKRAKRELAHGTDNTVGFRNESGEIYRYAVLNGMYQDMELDDGMEAIGLANQTEQGARKTKGLWAVYGESRDMTPEGLLKEMALIKRR